MLLLHFNACGNLHLLSGAKGQQKHLGHEPQKGIPSSIQHLWTCTSDGSGRGAASQCHRGEVCRKSNLDLEILKGYVRGTLPIVMSSGLGQW